ncbi:hypothetical protein EVAR_88072_1 [Eumeta japonica]|uniref:Uncharacterized protein n=1 Tax=Eumeta variegata TaxID=151549 RepID=A0A4C1WJA2_EUMVA|nr:hypothetical protein EVAR_88072_1 [Eumeta japonica]
MVEIAETLNRQDLSSGGRWTGQSLLGDAKTPPALHGRDHGARGPTARRPGDDPSKDYVGFWSSVYMVSF